MCLQKMSVISNLSFNPPFSMFERDSFSPSKFKMPSKKLSDNSLAA